MSKSGLGDSAFYVGNILKLLCACVCYCGIGKSALDGHIIRICLGVRPCNRCAGNNTFNCTDFGNLLFLCSCKRELSELGKCGFGFVNFNCICVSNCCFGKSALNNCNVYSFLFVCACNVCFKNLALNRCGIEALSICANDCCFYDSTLNGCVCIKHLRFCVRDRCFSDLTFNRINACKILGICSCNICFENLTFNGCYIEALSICASDRCLDNSALNSSCIKNLRFCACDFGSSKLAFDSGNLIKLNLISVSNCCCSDLTVDYACIGDFLFLSCCKINLSELGKSDFLIRVGKLFCASDFNAFKLTNNGVDIAEINCICMCDFSISDSTLNSGVITKINYVCTCDFGGSKLRCNSINVRNLLNLCASDSCFDNSALDRRCIKNLRLCASNFCIVKLTVNYGNIADLDCICASDSCLDNSALNSSCIKNLRFCVCDFCAFKLRVNIGNVNKRKLFCACNICSSKLCINCFNVNSILRICTNDCCLNDSTLNIGCIKNLGLCASNSCLVKLTLYLVNITDFNLICASNLGLGNVTFNGFYRLNCYFLCMSKLYVEKLYLYGSNVLYALFGKLCLNVRSEIVVLDDSGHVAIEITLGLNAFNNSFYIIICNGSYVLLLLLGALFLIERSNNCLGRVEHRTICYGIFIFYVYNTCIGGMSDLLNSLGNLAFNVTGLTVSIAHEDEYGTYNCGMTFCLGLFLNGSGLCDRICIYGHDLDSRLFLCRSSLCYGSNFFCRLGDFLVSLGYGSLNCRSYGLFYLRSYGSFGGICINGLDSRSFLYNSCGDNSCTLCILVDTAGENLLSGLLYLLLYRCFCYGLGFKYGSSLYCSLGSRCFLNYSCRDNLRTLYVLADATRKVNLFRLLSLLRSRCLLCLLRSRLSHYCSFGSRSSVLFCFGNDSGAIHILINTRIKSEVDICFCLCIGNGFCYGCFVLLCFLCRLFLINGSGYSFLGNKHKTINYILVTCSSLGYYLSKFLVINYASLGSIGSSFCYRCLCESGCFSCLCLLFYGCFRSGFYLFCRKCEELNAGILFRSLGGLCLLFYRCFGCLFYLGSYGSFGSLCINGLDSRSFLYNSCGDNSCALYILVDTAGENFLGGLLYLLLSRCFCLRSFFYSGLCYGSRLCLGSFLYSGLCYGSRLCLGSFLCNRLCYGSRLCLGSFFYSGLCYGSRLCLRSFFCNRLCYGSRLCLRSFLYSGLCYGSRLCLGCFGSLGFGLFYSGYVNNLYVSSLRFSCFVNLNLCLLCYRSLDSLRSYGCFCFLCINNGDSRYCCFGGSRNFLYYSCGNDSGAFRILVDTAGENLLGGLLYLLLSRCFCYGLGFKYGSSLYCSFGSRCFLNYSCRDNLRALYVLTDATGKVNLFRLLSLLSLLCLLRSRLSHYCSFGSRSFALFCFGNDSGAISILINTRIKSEVNICFCLCIGNSFCYGSSFLILFLGAFCLINSSNNGVA